MSSSIRRPAWLALLLSLVPGLGHLVLGRNRRALLLFVAGTFCLNLALLSQFAPIPPLGTWSLRLGVALGGAIGLFGILDVFRVGVYARLPSVVRSREQLLATAIASYLRREFVEARRILDGLLDVDPVDPLVRLYLATLSRRTGRYREAIHHAKRALAATPKDALGPELERELHLARSARRR